MKDSTQIGLLLVLQRESLLRSLCRPKPAPKSKEKIVMNLFSKKAPVKNHEAHIPDSPGTISTGQLARNIGRNICRMLTTKMPKMAKPRRASSPSIRVFFSTGPFELIGAPQSHSLYWYSVYWIRLKNEEVNNATSKETREMAAIERISLRKQVLEEIRRLILEGQLASGVRIRESELAAAIGVSRTPVREALHSLEREGQVFSDPGKGFAVSELKTKEAQELYPLRSLLEPLALRLSGLPDDQTLKKLRDLNDALMAVTSGAAWIDADDRWHDLLVEKCPNRHLLRMIDNLRRLTRRYEFAYLAGTQNDMAASTTQHEEIVASLEAGDLDQACDLLADNMVIGVEPILRWLQSP